MSEGVMALGMDGVINYVNAAAGEILDRAPSEMVGKKFAHCFLQYSENDAFIQIILNAICDSTVLHRRVVSFFTGTETRQLHVTTSYLHHEGERIGVIAVFDDVSELTELRDTVGAMERIKELNRQLELRSQLLGDTFGRFLSDEIVRQLTETPDGLALGGKKRVITILMSDLRGFTAISERLEANDLIAMLNHYLGEMTEIIQQHNGTIIEFIGDAIMAIFGVPIPSETHAADAVAAAVAMQARMAAINRWNHAHGYPDFEMGIGIHSGEVIVGIIGSEKRMKYGVVGSNVNLAGRIESYTVGGDVLISEATRGMITQSLEITREEEVFPKGYRAPITLSNVAGIGGKYAISCRQKIEPPQALCRAANVSFYIIHGKHSDLEPCVGQITALSRMGAVLRTEAPIDRFDNLRIEAGGPLFCKVMQRVENGWQLRFTALPTEFDAWYHSLCEAI